LAFQKDLMYHLHHDKQIDNDHLADLLAIAGIFADCIKQNASIAGSKGGCQAEVGTAVSMAAASAAYLMGQDIDQIEYAAEIGMEHHLGLTCDPVMGYVMIPCIERNAMGVLRARDAAILSKYLSNIRRHLVSFDTVVETMNETGKIIPIELKETAEGGLAREYLHEQ
jgi:L-serine dehydratase